MNLPSVVTPSWGMVGWLGFGVLLVVILTAVDAKIAGWVLLLLVVSMVYGAHTRGLI